jgi:CSLREA domain-containing protein
VKFKRRIALGTTTAIGGALLMAGTAGAATVPVTTTAEEAVVDNGACSLREALLSATGDANVGGCAGAGTYGLDDVVEIPPGFYQLTIPGAGQNDVGDLNIGNLTMRGTGPGQSVIEQTVPGQRTVTVNFAQATIENLVLSNAGVAVGTGGVVYSTSSNLAVRNTTITGGQTDSPGGGLSAVLGPGDVTSIENSTITSNLAGDAGGGVSIAGVGEMTIANSTITANRADTDNDGASDAGGGFAVDPGASLVLANSIVAGNFVDGNGVAPNCSTPMTGSQGVNVFGTDECGNDPANIVADPALLPLADNGGPTPTHGLSSTSPALDRGVGCLDTDQRGVPRAIGAPCDVGAYQLVTCNGRAANRVGTAGDDQLVGTEGPDAFLMLAGNDLASGLGGDDIACGGDGDDHFDAATGNDRYFGEDGNDSFAGADGNDTADLGDGNDTASGAAGNDKLKGKAGKDKLKGGAGKDKLTGGSGKDKLKGQGGKDKCTGSGGTDGARSCEKVSTVP